MRKITTNAREISEKKLAELKRDAALILAETRRAMLTRMPFTGSVAMNLDIVPVRDTSLETACTDGKRIYFDIDFLSELNADERMFVFGHEVWHNLLMHFARGENRDHELMNVATDLEVNQLLAKEGFSVLKDALMPGKLDVPDDKCAEEYYAILSKRKQTSGQSGSSGSYGNTIDKHIYSGDQARPSGGEQGQCVSDKYGKVGTDPDFAPGDPKDGVERIREAAVSASQVMERQRGSLPGHIRGLVEAILKPEIDWREQLQQFVTRSSCGETRMWNPPNRRHVHSGLYLQSRRGEKIRLAVGLDVSGSTSRDIPKFLAEVNGLVTSFGKYSMHVMQCDTEIKKCDVYTDDEPLDLENEKFETVGGGGTELRPIFSKIEEISDEGERPDAIVILTDGYVGKFSEDDDPGIPVMWVVTKDGNTEFSEFGDVIRLNDRDAA